MPIKDDFLTRMTERLEQTLVEVDTLTEQGHVDEALAHINTAYRESTGSDAQMVHRLSTDDLLNLLSTTGVLEVEKCLFMAELLFAEANVKVSQGMNVGAQDYFKTLELYLHALITEAGLIPHYQDKVTQLVDLLGELPYATERRLFAYDALKGDFAGAEDRLFELLEQDVNDDLLEEGLGFYTQLLTLSDEELEAGNLPRDEVEESLASLQAMQVETPIS